MSMERNQAVSAEYLLSIKSVAKKVDASETWIRDQMAVGEFPPGIRIGTLIRWRGAEIDEWIRQHAAKLRTVSTAAVRTRRRG